MAKCNKCGLEFDERAKFCPECGAPAGRQPKATPEPSGTDGKTLRRAGEPVYGVLNLEDLPSGHIIDERYEIKEKLGQGGFGAVYRAFDRNMDIDKALKVLPAAIAEDREAMLDLRSEAKAMVMLNHPNIVRVYDFHDSGHIKYIDMEYVDGKTLTDIKLEHTDRCVPEEKVKELALQIAKGLVYAHSQGVIHKDIKPQNIMVTTASQVKIMDFGIAETVRTSMSRVAHTSSSGTLAYMSPEQLRGKDVGKEADIYSFGAVLYELLSGHPPFYKGDIQYQVLNEEPNRIKYISQEMNDFLQKCLAKDYSLRYQNFEQVLRILEALKKKVKAPLQILKEPESREKVSIETPKSEAFRLKASGPHATSAAKRTRHITGKVIIAVGIVGMIAFAIISYTSNREKGETEEILKTYPTGKAQEIVRYVSKGEERQLVAKVGYYRNGAVSFEETYVNGQLRAYRGWWPEGQLRVVTDYTNDKVIREVNYDADGFRQLNQREVQIIVNRLAEYKGQPATAEDVVVMETSAGTIKLRLYTDIAPAHSDNFKRLANFGFYDSTTFHRVVPDFVIQGGDILSRDTQRPNDGTGGPGYTIPAEFNPRPHVKGTLAMARASDPNSAGSQFYIALRQLPQLNDRYTVFGEVTDGIAVVDSIAATPTDSGDNPLKPQRILWVRVGKSGEF